MNITIRQEIPTDYPIVFNLVEEAFRTMKYSNQTEHFLVEKLRKNEDIFIPELSLIAELEGKIVGHILLSKIHIKDNENIFELLSLAPVSVLPAFHKKGIGSQLVRESHRIAKSLGHTSVLLIGHKDYYPRFGYQPAHLFGIKFPFDSALENCMVVELEKNALDDVRGMVVYPKEFFE